MRQRPKPIVWILLIALACFLHSTTARAAGEFVVEDIRLEGLQRISAGTVFTYFPVQVGDTVDDQVTADAIRELFKTGFFKDVRMEREGNTLVVFVVERPSIDSINFVGNSTIETEQLLTTLDQIGFAPGRVFNKGVFDSIEQELKRLYFSRGRYAVKIDTTITPLERNRVAVQFDISEGKVATIKQINIVGNDAFDENSLLAEFQLKKKGLLTWISGVDQYSRERLGADLESLRSFYLDRGYINFNVDSTQVAITPDKKGVFITVNITEGEQYTISDMTLAGNLIVPEEELFELVTIGRGQVFSRKRITDTTTAIGSRLGNQGYAFANVNAVPEVDDETKTVAVTFFVDPGKRVYVRRINFSGNVKTRDEVLRREMRQMEGGWISTGAVERSRVRLSRTGYFDEVNVETPPVPGTTDQVDVEFSVKERPSGSLSAGLGFSQGQGLIFSTALSQENFLGTGNRVSFTFNNSSANRIFAFSFTDPYFTVDGVSLGINLRYQATDAANENIADYNADESLIGLQLGVPVNETDTVDLAVSGTRTEFRPGTEASIQVLEFAEQTGGLYYSVILAGEWSRDSRDTLIFANEGSLTSLNGRVVPGPDLEYFKLTASHRQYLPLTTKLTLVLNGRVGYGAGFGDTPDLPLTENYFAGGINSVRAYKANTLGPRDSRGDPLGGSVLLQGNFDLVFPVPFYEELDSVRLSAFIDAGNVFGDLGTFDAGGLRLSTGLMGVWLSPFGALTLSAGLPLNSKDLDETEPIQFTFGTTF